MTVTYSSEVTSSTGLGIFLKLLVRWKGSIYKIVWVDLLIYLVVYYSLNLIYMFVLDERHGKIHFINMVTYFSKHGSAIPLSFVLGFYVNVVYNRWWSQYNTIPYPDNIAMLLGASIIGKDEKSKIIRRTIIRYVCVAFTLTLTMISPKVKKRFPTLHHFVQSGLLTHEEKAMIEELDSDYPTYSTKYWLPLAWASNITTEARAEGIIKHELGLKDILEQLNHFREKCKQLQDYDWICVPLVYTQVVTLAVYLYFLFNAIGSQFIETAAEGDTYTFRFPLMSCVEFFFYMGWLKVAESLINPFGEDDDDFEVVWLIDRHLQVGYLLVDKIHNEHPKLTKDYHWNQTAPTQLPFTVASQKYMDEHPVESTCKVCIKKNDQDLIFREDMNGLEKNEESSSSKALKLDTMVNAPKKTQIRYYNGVFTIVSRMPAGAKLIIEPTLILNRGRNPIKQFFSRKKIGPTYSLKRVKLHTDQQNDEGWDEYNTYEGEESIDNKRKPSINEFNSLREERLEKRKDDLLRLLDILKDDKEKARQILDEIIR